MMNQNLCLRSSIKPALKRSLLFRGTLLATLGIALLIYAGLTLSVATLEHWGLPIFGISLALITAGLLPYKRLTRLEMHPHELLLTSDHEIRFFQKRTLCITLSWENIEKIAYVDHPSRYGIALWLKNPDSKVFFPFFSERSYHEMIDFFN